MLRKIAQKARAFRRRRLIGGSGFFDPEYYLYNNLDVKLTGANPLKHYMEFGWREGRPPSAEFNSAAYLRDNPDVARAAIDPLLHYIQYGAAEGRQLIPCFSSRKDRSNALRRLRESGLFDEEFYLRQCPIVRDAKVDSLLHYLVSGYKAYLEPNSKFSMIGYVAANPDVREADCNPLLHYIDCGQSEGRLIPSAAAPVNWTRPDGGPPLPDDCIHHERLLGINYLARFAPRSEAGRISKYLLAAIDELAACKPDLEIVLGSPTVSILIPVHGQTSYVLNCLHSLARHRSRFEAEIILVDDESPEETHVHRLEAIPWIRYKRLERNVGFLEACNAGAKLARGRYLILLNSDTRVVQGWLDELIGSFDLFPKAGLVGSKLFNEDGSLQEAGGIVWRDGSASNYGRNQDPNHPKYCFARRVDYCSGAAIAVDANLWREAGGFDTSYRPAYFEDTDLAFRVRDRGREVWYQPLARVLHYEGKSHGRDLAQGRKAYQLPNQQVFARQWSTSLGVHASQGQGPDREAHRQAVQRLLVMDAVTPTPDQDSGSYITARTLKAFQELGYQVTFVPQTYAWREQSAALQREGVECLYAPYFTNIEQVIDHRNDVDVVLVFRYMILQPIYYVLRRRLPAARIILHVVDLHHIREQREAELMGSRSGHFAAMLTRANELEMIARSDCTIVHSLLEKARIQEEVALSNIVVFPYIADLWHTTAAFEDRADIMFLGGFDHAPNVDAVQFFVSKVWPILVEKLPKKARFLIVGASLTDDVKALADSRIIVTGRVPELGPYFDRSRVFVAPLRYGAGIKGKLVQSLSHGVPSVATTIAVEGMELTAGTHTLVADDPEAIASAVLSLYGDSKLWSAVQRAGQAFVQVNYSWSRCLQLCTRVLDTADAMWLARADFTRRSRLAGILARSGERSGTEQNIS